MKYFVSFLILLQSSFYFSQNILPNKSTPAELSKEVISNYINNYYDKSSSVITTQPSGNLRTMAEWEEVQAICITWTGYKSILAKIVEEAQTECEVIILCNNVNSAQNELSNYGVSFTNVNFVVTNYNSIWVRDYGGNTSPH